MGVGPVGNPLLVRIGMFFNPQDLVFPTAYLASRL
jgi:hypothetical protein